MYVSVSNTSAAFGIYIDLSCCMEYEYFFLIGGDYIPGILAAAEKK
jgi:hypothetical protein